MILSPLPNTTNILGQSVKPYITQGYGLRPEYYKKYGLKGHPGLDFRAKTPLPVYAPVDGMVEVVDSGSKGYGLHVVITNQRFRITLAHLSNVEVGSKQVVTMGEVIGRTGNTGDSSAPHLHLTVQKVNGGIVKDKDNGFGGAQDVAKFIICWTSTL